MAHQGAVVLDGSLCVESCSPEFCEIFGCEPAGVIGKDIDTLVEGSGFSMRLRAGEVPDEICSLGIPGNNRMARIQVERAGMGFVCWFEAVREDDLLYRLIAVEQRWKGLFRASDDGIGVIDDDGRIVEHNAAFTQLLGLPVRSGTAPQENAHIGIKLEQLLSIDVPGFRDYLAAPAGEFRGRRDTGAQTFELDARPIVLPDGARTGTIIVARDIAEALQLRARDAQIRNDLEKAQVFQQLILSKPPSVAPYRLEIAYRPLDHVGGDLYDVADLPAGSVRFFIADATGHGVPAALVTMLVRSAYESVKYTLGGPAAVLEALNDRVATAYRSSDAIFTALVVDLSLETGYLEYANGGHPPPIIVDSTGARELEAGGTVLGARGYRTYPAWSTRLAPDASIYLITDGLPEARRGDEYFGDPRVLEAMVAADRAPSATEGVMERFDAWLAGTPPNDDITLLAIRPAIKAGS